YGLGHVEDSFLHRISSSLAGHVDYSRQIRENHTLKAGVSISRHTLRYYEHLFPTALGLPGYANNDAIFYGFDAYGREADLDSEYVDSSGSVFNTIVDSAGILVNRPVPPGRIMRIANPNK